MYSISFLPMISLVEQERRFKPGNNLIQIGKPLPIKCVCGITVVHEDCKFRICGEINAHNAQPANLIPPLFSFRSGNLLSFRGLLPDFPLQGGKLVSKIFCKADLIRQPQGRGINVFANVDIPFLAVKFNGNRNDFSICTECDSRRAVINASYRNFIPTINGTIKEQVTP